MLRPGNHKHITPSLSATEACGEIRCRVDASGKIEWINQAATCHLRYEPEELIGKHFSIFIFEEDLQASFAAFEKTRREFPLVVIENRIKDKKNNAFWFSWSLMYEITTDTVLAVGKKLTQQNSLTAVMAIRDQIINDSGIILWDWMVESDLWTGSSFWKTITGHPCIFPFWSKRKWKKIIHPEDREAWLSAIGHYLGGKSESISCEFRVKTTAGHYLWFLANGKTALRNEEGGIVKIVGTLLNLTGQKNRQQAFINSMKMVYDLNQALNESSIIAKTDVYGIITHVNDEFCKISGYSEEELIGQTHRVVNSGYHDKAFFQHMWETIKGGEVWKGEIRNRKKSGEFYWTETTIVPMTDKNGIIKQYIAIRRDITERKLAELSLKELNETLRQKVEDMNQFSYITSHNLRAPVANLMGLLQMLKESRVEAGEIKDWAKKVLNVGEELDQIVQDMNQTISIRTEAENPMGLVSLSRTLAEVREILAEELSVSGVRIYANFEQVPFIWSAHGFLKNIFTHLIQNCIQHKHPSHDPEIFIQSDTNEGKIVITVADNGTGMDVEDTEFQQFRLYHAIETKDRTDMGLHIVWQHVTALHGEISIRSKPFEGKEIRIIFPQKLIRKPEDIKQIYLIDDDSITNMLHSKIAHIETPGTAVNAFSRATEALDRIEKNIEKPDLILLDINMPEMDGWQFLTALEKLPKELISGIDIVVLSSSIFSDDKIKAYSFPMVRDFYSKPLTREIYREIFYGRKAEE
ncbi:MAG: PAS domain S-box protein [Bacteroidia bacterium]